MSRDVVIELAGLTKYYGPHRGIEDLDLEVRGGRAFGFLGPNGAGKSTTMRVLLDFQRATAGSARVLGLDSRRDSLAIRAVTGYLSGDVALYERLTALEHLTWLGELRGGVARREIETLAERIGLDLSRRIGDLSKGNRQKVGLVQAFVHRPELLVLDEPTSGLDPLVQHTFRDLVREVVDDGRTVFLSSHVLDEIERTCDEVAIIREGRLVAVEAIETLRERSMREVRITFEHAVPDAAFLALDGVQHVEVDGSTVRLRTVGGIDGIVKEAARHRVVDFVTEQADLETVFLQFYGGATEGGGSG